MEGSFTALLWIGRILFAAVFIMSGLNHLMQMAAMTQYAEAKGLPAARLMVPLSGIVIILGGLSILFWVYVPVGAWLLALFLVVTAFKMHDFWAVEDPQMQQNEMAHFLKDLALAGAAIVFYVVAQRPGLFLG